MWCSWRTVSAPSGASRYQPLIGAEQATSLAGGLDSLGGDGGCICPIRSVSPNRVYQMTVGEAGSAEMLSKCYRICKIPFIYVKAHVIMHT